MDHQGKPALVPDSADRDLVHTPSVVYLNGRTAFVGSVVDALLEQDPSLPVVRYFKRHLGELTPILFDREGTGWMPEAIGALVLKKLRFDAETATSLGIDGAVITVPAHFNDVQRKAVKAAALLADLPLAGLVDEPVAAALHYGVANAAHERVLLVFDWGGGTFDATALSLTPRGVYVLAKTGLTDLGGKEIDETIGARVLARFDAVTRGGFVPTARALVELRRVSEQLKYQLCMPGATSVTQLVLLSGSAADVTIRLDEFLDDTASLVERTTVCVLDCVAEAGLAPRDVDIVLLVGGSSLLPLVEQRLRAIFSAPHQQVLYHEPTKAVAFGAALHASQLSGEAERFDVPPEFRGVTGHSVGVRTMDLQTGRVRIDTLIRQNMPLPAKVSKTYFSSRADQQRIVLDLVQFRDGDEANFVPLGRLEVGPLPAPRRNYPVQVTVEGLEDGTIKVQAWDAETGVELEQTFARDGAGGVGHLTAQRALVRATSINSL